MNASQGVVITGLGAITPSGQNPETLWQSVRSGTSAIDVLAGEQFDDLAVRIAELHRGERRIRADDDAAPLTDVVRYAVGELGDGLR